MTLHGKTAVVTGARGGMGSAIVERFRREGAKVYGLDLPVEPSSASSTTDDHFLAVDVTSPEQVEGAFDLLGRDNDRLDIVVNTAAIEVEKTIEETTLDEWNRSFATNVTGTFLTCKYALPLLRKTAGDGVTTSIINFGSYDGFIADPGLAAYSATKGAVHALTKAMACDHGPEGIRVNAVCPGYIDTPMLQSFFNGEGSGADGRSIDEVQDAVRDIHPMRRYGTPDDIANLVHWLASDEARYASGQLWVLDGGLTAQVQQMSL